MLRLPPREDTDMHAPWKRLAVLPLLVCTSHAVAQTADPATAATMQRAPQAQVPEERTSRVDRIRDYTVARRDEALDAARNSTEALDRDIARLQQDVQERWASLGSDARARTSSALAELRDRRTRLAEWYGGMQHGSDRAWDEVKSGFVDSYHTLSDAFRRARWQFDAARREAAPEKAPEPSGDKER